MIELLSITFVHVPSDTGTAVALPVRKNANEEVLRPEWQARFPTSAEDSVAVYAISDVAQHQVTIRVRLRLTDLQTRQVSVRAIDDAPPDRPRGCFAIASWFIGRRPELTEININVLGQVQEREVDFGTSEETEALEFVLTGMRTDLGVVSGITTWRWQYRVNVSDRWTDILTAPDTPTKTVHTGYMILLRPIEPWVAEPGDDELSRHSVLWTDVLEHACWWARGQRTKVDAAGGITEQLYARGALRVLRYATEQNGEPQFTVGHYFQLQSFLIALASSGGPPQAVNCDDCACALVVFANALGCELCVGHIEGSDWFYLNPVLAIGLSDWDAAISNSSWNGDGNHFFYHTVAMTGEATDEDNVFDAMLQLNGNPNPANRPYRPMLAKNLLFGVLGSIADTYRHRLAKNTPASQGNCRTQSGLRYRPTIWQRP